MDKNNERDTHFQGFAKLLWDELKEFDPYDFDLTAKDSWQILHSGEGYDPSILEEHIKRIIAQRAYDLVYHTILNVDCYDLVALPYEEIPPRIPDLVPDITLDGTPYPKPPKP